MFNSDFDIKDFKEKVNRLPDDATIQDVLQILGMNNRLEDERHFENEPPMDMPRDSQLKDKPPFHLYHITYVSHP